MIRLDMAASGLIARVVQRYRRSRVGSSFSGSCATPTKYHNHLKRIANDVSRIFLWISVEQMPWTLLKNWWASGRRAGWRARVRAVCKPGSVLDRGRGVTIRLGRASPRASRNLPERSTRKKGLRPKTPPLLFGLAPGGVCRAVVVADAAVRSCRTLSPLPASRPARRPSAPAGGLLSVALSLGSPPPGVTRHRFSVEPGLSSLVASGRPVATRAVTRPPRTQWSCSGAAGSVQAGDGPDHRPRLAVEQAVDPGLPPVALKGGDHLARHRVRQV